MEKVSVDHLTALGNKVDGSLTAAQLETFAKPKHVDEVVFTSHEVGALCPVTEQPDLYTVIITYEPDEVCVESKTLKLYLTTFRNTGIFGEAIAATIADDLFNALKPHYIKVEARQQIRGGLQMTTFASRGGIFDE